MADKNLTVKIKGDNAGLAAALKKSKAGVTKFGGFLTKFGSKFGILGAGLVGTAAGGLAGGLTIKVFTGAIEEVDKLTKLGKQFGITTQQVQKFKAVATLTGTNLQQLLKGFGQLSKSIVQFVRDGTGPGKKVFADLGLTAEQLSAAFQKGPIETLRVFGQALNKIENPLERSALLEELLGARNKELAVALSDVDTVFGQVNKSFKDNDLALTEKQTTDVEKFRDTWAEIGTIIDSKVLKKMSDLAGELQGLADSTLNLVESIVQGSVGGLGNALTGIGDAIDRFVAEHPAFFASPILRGLAATTSGTFKTLGEAFSPTPASTQFQLSPGMQQFQENARNIVLPGEAGRVFADTIIANMPPGTGRILGLGGAGGLPAAGTGTINGRSLADMVDESKKQTNALDRLNTTVEKSFFKNERTGRTVFVAAP